ncbi:hypothetical protein DPMN_143544 [Dreissena polymorpha]|uniref:Uncharacterized protein n=1 Tax=Dreissena polymorpha TaxID=45954 RepID=A0A9D4GHB2_DREPO|nr:hypothetical protein DPMN_143544 [Dreissena polymorpha]
MHTDYPKGLLKEQDTVLRAEVIIWLKLPECSQNVSFYESLGKGGLGLPKYEICAPAQRVNTLKRIAQSNDIKIRRMSEVFKLNEKVSDIASKAGLKLPSKLITKVQ